MGRKLFVNCICSSLLYKFVCLFLLVVPYKWLWLSLCFSCVSYLVAAVSLQSLWSLSLAIVDIYAILVRRSLQNCTVVGLFAVGDGVRELVWMIFFSNTVKWFLMLEYIVISFQATTNKISVKKHNAFSIISCFHKWYCDLPVISNANTDYIFP